MRPAWSGAFAADRLLATPAMALPSPITPLWAWEGADGAGVRVAVVDSGIDASHPAVGAVARSVAVEASPDCVKVVDTGHEDLYGHGTACAAIIRRVAPAAELISVRVLGGNLKASGAAFVAGIRWALDNGAQVVNLSLSSRNRDWFATLHDLVDEAYFKGVMLVCAVNNVDVPSYPSLYAAVFSVAASDATDPFSILYNPLPPVEFGAPGIDIDVAWLDGATTRVTGNSFAAAHVSGLVVRILSKHPHLNPFQMKTVLHSVAANARHPA